MPLRARLPTVSLQPMAALLDTTSVIEHAVLDAPDPSLGHCVDDAGRALMVACLLPNDSLSGELASRCLLFLEHMYDGGGRFRLRDVSRGDSHSDDASARALHGLGIAAAQAPWRSVRVGALRLIEDVSVFDSPYPRAQAHALLGAVAAADCAIPGVQTTILRLATALDRPPLGPGWIWPEPRLTYSNALVPHAIIAAAHRLDDAAMQQRGLRMLRWLLDNDTGGGHYSPVPAGGWAAGEPRPGFDQQPIEAWAMADAARCALEVTSDPQWRAGIHLAAGWFAGDNDARQMMWDPHTGRAFDGLHAEGLNRNQGAESALALIATLIDLDWEERWSYRRRLSS
jgi:hypothetical protein